MLNLYLMNAAPFQEDKMVQKALLLVEARRRERVMQMKDNKNRALSLAAGVLLSYAVNREMGISSHVIDENNKVLLDPNKPSFFTKQMNPYEAVDMLAKALENGRGLIPDSKPGTNGKPYFVEMPELFFNLSHSGDYVVCALSDSEVGIDIQQYRKNIKDGVFKRVLHTTENELFEKCDTKEKETYFYQIWAAKEAFPA